MANPNNRILRVAVNGYGVIGKRVADAVAAQDDMVLSGVCDIQTDWRPKSTELSPTPCLHSA